MEPSDRELVQAARSGETQAMGLLLVRHRAAKHAVAASVLGAGPEVEDVVQDASLVALTDLSKLREPALARAWLTGVTRNLAHARLRRPDPLPTDLSALPAADDPGRRIEDAALRDWVWEAIDGLSRPLQEVVVLRYFSAAASYGAIAAALAIPVGTVRSRLHDARTVLGSRLRELETPYNQAGHNRTAQAREQLFAAIVTEYNGGSDLGLLRSVLAEGARLTVAASDELIVGRTAITRSLAEDLEAGIRLQLVRVVSGSELTVVEGAFLNPPDAPDHCPAYTTQVYRHRGERIAGLHLAYSA